MPKRMKYRRTLSFVLLFFFLAGLTPPVSAAGFNDISGHWARNDILQLTSLSIVKGSAGRFYPDGAVTRAEFAAMIIKALGYGDQAGITQGLAPGYSDVPGYHWASGFVNLAREKGVISGYPDGSFKPEKVISRGEITSVLVRALQLPLGAEETLTRFTDSDAIPGWARSSISAAYSAGLVSGFPDGSFRSERAASRGETAALIKKVLVELGRQYTIYASVEAVSADGKSLTLNIAGQQTTLLFAGGATLLVDGKLSGPYAIKAGDYVYVNLDDEGNVTYLERGDSTFAGIGGFTGSEGGFATTALPGNREREIPSPKQGLQGEKAIPSDEKAEEILTVLISTAPGGTEELAGFIRLNGGLISLNEPELNFMVAEVDSPTLDRINHHPLAAEVTVSEPVEVTEPQNPESGESNTGGSPAKSLETTRMISGAAELAKQSAADGSGQVIAIIDTGIDPGHPDLQKTTGGQPKIRSWVDFTGEGDIDTSAGVSNTEGVLHLINGDYRAGRILSVSGQYHYGYLQERAFTTESGDGIDINFNGSTNDVLAVLITDSKISGKYDTVYIDTDNNKDFADEKGLTVYENKYDYTGFKSADGKNDFNVVLTRIDKAGQEINLGFDGNDHGTHVAGITAANGTVRGFAPGAQVMALKVLNSAGMGDPATISEAIIYAARQGAKVINLSLGFRDDDAGSGALDKLITDLSTKYGVLFVTAAGNDGPGMSTAAGLGDTASVVSVGAFSAPEMWRVDYGWEVAESNLWYFSSIGPHQDGSPAVSVVAPGSVVSTVPLRKGEHYYLSEGTSMAAPHVSGAAALLLDAAARNKLTVSPGQLKTAFEQGARPIPGYAAVEQGYGVLNVASAWEKLQLMPGEVPNVGARSYDLENRNSTGVFAREYLPGRMTYYLSDQAGRRRNLELSSTAPWLKPEQWMLNIPASRVRGMDVEVQLPEEPGLYSAYLTGVDKATSRRELSVLTTAVKPYSLNNGNNYRVNVGDSLTPARYKRYFFRVAPGADKLQVKLSVPGGAGRVRMLLYDPKGGKEVARTDFAGVNSGDTADTPGKTVETVEVTADFPAAGTWEVVVYSSASLSAYGLMQSTYQLDFAMEGLKPVQLAQKTRDILVSVLPKPLIAGRRTYLTVQVRDRYTLKPYEGLLDIDGTVYFTRRGRVLLPVAPEDTMLQLNIRTVPEPGASEPLAYQFKLPVEG